MIARIWVSLWITSSTSEFYEFNLPGNEGAHCPLAPCSFGLSATNQQYFSLRTNQPPGISQQYFSLRTNQHQPPAKRTGCSSMAPLAVWLCHRWLGIGLDPGRWSNLQNDSERDSAEKSSATNNVCITSCWSIAMQALEASHDPRISLFLHGNAWRRSYHGSVCSGSWHPSSHVLFSMETELSCMASMLPSWTAIKAVADAPWKKAWSGDRLCRWHARAGSCDWWLVWKSSHYKLITNLVIWNPMLNRLPERENILLASKTSDWIWYNNADIVQAANRFRSLLNAPCYKRGKNHTYQIGVTKQGICVFWISPEGLYT
jgi:hypothetical protein